MADENKTAEQAVADAQPIITPPDPNTEARKNIRAALRGRHPSWPVPPSQRVEFFASAEADLAKQALALELDYAGAEERKDSKGMAQIELQASKVYGALSSVRKHLSQLAVNTQVGV